MHVLIATDGTLDAAYAAPYVKNLAGDGGRATVVTVVEVNRTMLGELRALFGERPGVTTDQDAEYVGVRSGDASGVSPNWPGDDAMIARYLADQGAQRTAPVVEALRDAGVEHDVVTRDGEDAASVIIDIAGELDADAVVVGPQGSGVFDGLLGSTSTKLARRCPVPVLVLRRP
ncbi:MAG: universal stress protein [Acidimicrobiia bacterium]|nr:universal stress protein [Acidimicrobiia bacterium]